MKKPHVLVRVEHHPDRVVGTHLGEYPSRAEATAAKKRLSNQTGLHVVRADEWHDGGWTARQTGEG